jgi:2-oxo-4-hydroxy-4-carboxy-5-ureidoimidazoline decarboxylase
MFMRFFVYLEAAPIGFGHGHNRLAHLRIPCQEMSRHGDAEGFQLCAQMFVSQHLHGIFHGISGHDQTIVRFDVGGGKVPFELHAHLHFFDVVPVRLAEDFKQPHARLAIALVNEFARNHARRYKPAAAMNKARFTLMQINAFTSEEFVRVVGPVFEHSPWIAEITWGRRPFGNFDDLHRALCDTVALSDRAKQISLIRAHPDLAVRAAMARALTPESVGEQASAGLDRVSAEEVAAFTELNQAYREKFGFPFVICARLNKKEAILAALRARLLNSQEQEIRLALDEICNIARLRLEDLAETS